MALKVTKPANAIFGLALSPFLATLTGSLSATDPVANLGAEMESGKTALRYSDKHGYLESVLSALKIDVRSQVLVFSKSSMQSSMIGPDNPRAIYFNDHTYVGWIPGAPLIEVMTVDPKLGVAFYTLANKEMEAPRFVAETSECTPCHGRKSNTQSPNLIARSSEVAPSGYPRVFSRTFSVVPSLPLDQRWGGWYVTGTHGEIRHMGNELSIGTDEIHAINKEKGANVTDLSKYFETGKYLAPHSDIVALMVLEQQMDVQNDISQANLRARNLIDKGESESAASEIQGIAESLVSALLCSREAKLTAEIKGTSGFSEFYEQSAPKDKLGRSLSQLDLKTRVLKFPCSPLIYSASFEALPAKLKKAVWKSLSQTLRGKEASGYAHLTADDRQAILEILKDTKPEFAEFLATE